MEWFSKNKTSSSVNTVNTNEIKNFSEKRQRNLSFRYNLIQSYNKQRIHCVFLDYTRHRLEIIKHTSAHSQNKTKLKLKELKSQRACSVCCSSRVWKRHTLNEFVTRREMPSRRRYW